MKKKEVKKIYNDLPCKKSVKIKMHKGAHGNRDGAEHFGNIASVHNDFLLIFIGNKNPMLINYSNILSIEKQDNNN